MKKGIRVVKVLKWNLWSFPWWKEPKIKDGDSYELGVMIYKWTYFLCFLRGFGLKWNLCSFPWWKEPKIKAGDSYELGVMIYGWT